MAFAFLLNPFPGRYEFQTKAASFSEALFTGAQRHPHQQSACDLEQQVRMAGIGLELSRSHKCNDRQCNYLQLARHKKYRASLYEKPSCKTVEPFFNLTDILRYTPRNHKEAYLEAERIPSYETLIRLTA